MERRSFSLNKKDLKRLDSIKEALGIPSRSETVRRMIDREFTRIGGELNESKK